MLTLFDYQTDLVNALREAYGAGRRRVVAVLPTGGGKTVVASHIIASAVQRGRRVNFLAHRSELIDQASGKLTLCGIPHGRIQAGGQFDGQPVQVSSIPTLARRDDVPPADLVVIDECHHTNAGSWAALVGRYPEARILGLTATPYRTDGRGLGEHYDDIVSRITVSDLISRGRLVRPITYAHRSPDMAGVRKVAGDYAKGETAARCDQQGLIGDIVAHWRKLASGRCTVAFCASVAHAEHVAESFAAAGIPAASVDGSMHDKLRADRLAMLADGRLSVVTNVGILTEGWDLPACSCIIQARPTQSMSLYLQIVGRGLRSMNGKSDCIILDHAGNTMRHGFVTDPIEFTLEGVRKKNAGGAAAIRTCPQCCGAWPGGTQVCKLCGYVWPPPEPKPLPKVASGSLTEVKPGLLPGASRAEKIAKLARLQAKAKERGYRGGWVSHKFRAIYGHFPEPTWKSH